jgi:hypothetical protein
MLNLKRFIIVRQPSGDDEPVPYEVTRFDTVAEAARYFGDSSILAMLHRTMDRDTKQRTIAEYRFDKKVVR